MIKTEKRRLLMRKYALDWCNKTKAPDVIVEEAKKMFNITIETLKKENFDALKYLESEAGKVDYFIYCVDSDQSYQCGERCGKCHHYVLLNENTIKCELNKLGNVVCSDFDDSGFDFNERLMKFSINRCWKCMNWKSCLSENEEDGSCKLNCSTIKVFCEYFKEKLTESSVI